MEKIYQELVEENRISPFDRFFAERASKEKNLEEKEKFSLFLFLSYLSCASRQGHICVTVTEKNLTPSLSELWGEKGKALKGGVLQGSYLFTEEIKGVHREKNHYYLERNWVYEKEIFTQIKRLIRSSPDRNLIDEKKFVENLEEREKKGILFPSQKEGIEKLLGNSLHLIYGGPGTGKSYLARQLLEVFIASARRPLHIGVYAPTGKAMAHIKEKIGEISEQEVELETKTLHAFLEVYEGRRSSFSGWRKPPHLLLVDEASMIDIRLMAHLLEGTAEGSYLVCMGDPNQLPPVESGHLFFDLLQIEKISKQELDRSIRFENGGLYTFSKAVLQGETKNLFSHQDVSLEELTLDNVWAKALDNFPYSYENYPDSKKLLEEFSQFRILSSFREGPFGVEAINRELYQKMEEKTKENTWFCFPILVVKNDFSRDFYNGQEGVVIGKKGEERKAWKAFFLQNGEMIEHPFYSLPQIQYGYCLSVHKSQGSEYKRVLFLSPEGTERFGRNILYTAATRAKEKLVIAGCEKTVRETIEKISLKNSALRELSSFL